MSTAAPATPDQGQHGTGSPGSGPLYAGFLFVGIATVLLGPLLPLFAERWGVSAATAARLFPAQFIAGSVGSILSTFALRRSMTYGYTAIAFGILGLSTGSWPLALPSMVLIGLGTGAVPPASNSEVARRNPDRRGAALATLNLVWGLGAAGSPLLFAAAVGRIDARWVLLVLGLVVLVFAIYFAIFGPPAGRTSGAVAEPVGTNDEQNGASRGSKGAPATIGGSGVPHTVALAIGGCLFLYIGTEISLGGWLVELAERSGDGHRALSLLLGSGFWASLIAGRALTPILLRRISERTLLSLALGISLIGTLVLIVATGLGALAAVAVICGLALAPVFPLLLSILTRLLGTEAEHAMGWFFAVGGLGGAVLPWLSGQLLPEGSNSAPPFFVPAAAITLLIGLVLYIRRVEIAPDAKLRTPATPPTADSP